MKIKAKLKKLFKFDLVNYFVCAYRNILPLYRTTFWTVFIVLNIVFAYHTANFLWGNHEWVYMRQGITWGHFWYEARFTETIPYILFGFEFLPILLNLFAFAGISCSMVVLARYWKLPQTKFAYLAFCLPMAVIPYNLCWLYHVAQTSFVWGVSIIVLGLALLERISRREAHWFWNILVIFLLWFSLGFNAAFINTIFICAIGRWIVDLLNGEKLSYLLKKGILLLIDILSAGGLLKLSIYLADKYHFLGDDFYNVNTIKLAEIWPKFKEVLGYCISQFTYTYPFFEASCLYLLLGVSAAALPTLLFVIPRHRRILRFILLLMGLAGMLFATQLAIFISENRIKLQYMFRLTGFFSLYYVFAFMLSCLCRYWKKIFLKNVLFLVVIGMTGLFIQRDMYAMRVWKQGLDAENKVYDRVLARIENTQGFSYNNRYRIIIVGDLSLRDRYYKGKYKDKDATVLGWSYRAPWTYTDYFNFYAPTSFLSGGLQNAWGLKYTEKLFPQLSEDTIRYLLDKMDTWPTPGSVLIKDKFIFLFMSNSETRAFKRLLKDYYRERQSFNESQKNKIISVFHPHWDVVEDLRLINADTIKRESSGDIATILEFNDDRLVLKWNRFGVERFIKNDSDIYVYDEDQENEPYGADTIMASHPAWEAQPLRFISRNKIMRVANSDIAVVAKHTDTELILDWYSYGKERFIKDENNIYRFTSEK